MGYLEYLFSFTYESQEPLYYLTIGLENERGRIPEITTSEYPPVDEDDCTQIMKDLEENISKYIESNLIHHVEVDNKELNINSPEDLRRELNGDKFLFIRRV